MPDLLTSISESVACRACGAVRGPRATSDNDGMEWTVCQNCWHAFGRWRGGHASDSIEADFNHWLARKLFLDLRRLDQTGIVGRCECISDWLYGRRGQQCALRAVARLQEGHLVCRQHLNSSKRVFVDDGNPNRPYDMLGAIVSRLVKRDKKLLAMLSAAIGLDSEPFSRIKYGHGKGSTPIDLSGREFGRLTAMRLIDRAGKGRHRYWLCRCSCGAEKEIRSDALINGYHLSCGCHRREASAERVAKQKRNAAGHFLNVNLS
jgi:hypothetical protein